MNDLPTAADYATHNAYVALHEQKLMLKRIEQLEAAVLELAARVRKIEMIAEVGTTLD